MAMAGSLAKAFLQDSDVFMLSCVESVLCSSLLDSAKASIVVIHRRISQ